MSDLEHLQSILLDMAKYIDQLCQDNNIKYYLDGGSALGAIRHKGFIPWDDDFDIIMDSDNYDRFIKICKTQLSDDYYLQEGRVDWPSNFSKIRLKGTRFIEEGNPITDPDKQGIFIDLFRLENSPSNRFRQWRQYVFAKLLLANHLYEQGYKTNNRLKAITMFLARPLSIDSINKFCMRQVYRYQDKECTVYGALFNKTNMKNAFFSKRIWGEPTYVPFEDTMLPVQEYWDEYLTIVFGDYMTPPPANKQVPEHMNNIFFGKY